VYAHFEELKKIQLQELAELKSQNHAMEIRPSHELQ